MENNSFGNLFSNCTENVLGDGNCFIHSLIYLYPEIFSDVITTRRILYSNNHGDVNLKKNGAWVDVFDAAIATSHATNRPIVFVLEHFSIVAENGETKVVNQQERNNYISAGIDTIVYHNQHFQPLKNETEIRQQFVSGLTEIEKAQHNKNTLDSVIDNNFKKEKNREQAKKIVAEILRDVPDDEKDNMLTILLCGIIAEGEHQGHHKRMKKMIAKATKKSIKYNATKATQPQIEPKMTQLI